jgi:hypothetical protein
MPDPLSLQQLQTGIHKVPEVAIIRDERHVVIDA